MPGSNETGVITATAGAAIAQHLRVKLSAGVLAVAVLADRELGTLEEEAVATAALFAAIDDDGNQVHFAECIDRRIDHSYVQPVKWFVDTRGV
jgi:hypothetical protein